MTNLVDPAAKRIGAFVLILVLTTMGLFVVINNRFDEDIVVSEIDNVGYNITDTSDIAMNITLQFSVTIENYGTVKKVKLPCGSVQSYLDVKNSTVPLITAPDTGFNSTTAYFLNTTYTSSPCTGEPTTVRVSENIIDEIIVTVPFRLITGNYSFIWYHSYADTFHAAKIDITVEPQAVQILLEVPTEN